MLKLYRVTQVKLFFLVLAYIFNFDLFEFSAAILHGEGSIHNSAKPDDNRIIFPKNRVLPKLPMLNLVQVSQLVNNSYFILQ